ncbi:hypothetical protein J6590_099291 [Homalodisca vitripennis]|nr:hypothetical protein J6590_099291 [Homalodisca vitripennis]
MPVTPAPASPGEARALAHQTIHHPLILPSLVLLPELPQLPKGDPSPGPISYTSLGCDTGIREDKPGSVPPQKTYPSEILQLNAASNVNIILSSPNLQDSYMQKRQR